MTDMARQHIRDWLVDAHAIEVQAEKLFSGHADKLNAHPEIQKRLHFEINYATEHKVLLSIRMQQLGCNKSLLKDIEGKLSAKVKNFSGIAVNDEPVKVILTLHSFTQMAIGSYQILIAAALELNDNETLTVCKTILNRAQSRANWIEEALAYVTRLFILNSE
ncbi:MAG: DUF892 family protein [Cellvibrio sp.]|uniref:DUF892 family protein n=1 Tax=Cellvibrio sp. TaxID=1965322 RepID=UPI0031B4B18B